MYTASGTYTGNGTNPRAIPMNAAFQPDVVLIKATNTEVAEIYLSSMAAGSSKAFSNSAESANAITAVSADGFTVSSNGNVNQNGTVYHWFAAKVDAADSAVFSYTGDGTDNRNVGSFSFTPAFALCFRTIASNRIVWRSDQHSGDSSQEHNNLAVADRIQALNAGSIQVGTLQNANGAVYHVWVVAAGAGRLATAEYTGDGTDNRDIAHGLGAVPILTIIHAQTVTAQNMVARFKDHVGDLSSNLNVTVTADSADWIQAVDGTNVQVGTNARVNSPTSSPLYTLVTFGEVPAPRIASGAPSLEGLMALAFAEPIAAGVPSMGLLEAAGAAAVAFTPIASTIWMPDIPPLGGTASDEFNLNSGGVPAGWTEVDHDAIQTVTEDEAGLVLTHPTHAGDSVAGVYKALPSGDGTIFMQCSRTGIGLTNFLTHALALWEDATNAAGRVITFGITNNATQLELGVNLFSAYNVFGSALSGQFVLSPDVLWTGFYLRIRRAGSTFNFEFSNDGIGWVRIYSSAALAFTPAQYGPAMTNNATGTTAVLRSKFCRYSASDIGLTGLSLGARRGAISIPHGGGGIWRPEARPLIAHAEDSEFDVAGAGAPSGFTLFDPAASGAVSVDDGGLLITQAPSPSPPGTTPISGIYRTIPPGDFTIMTKVSIACPWVTPTVFGAGFALWQDAPGPSGGAYTFGLETYHTGTTSKITGWRWNSYQARNSEVITLNSINGGPGHVGCFLRLHRSGTTYTIDWSSDGIGWIQVGAAISLVFVPQQFGFFVYNSDNNTGLSMAARFQFWRYRPSDVGLTALAEGDRVALTVA